MTEINHGTRLRADRNTHSRRHRAVVLGSSVGGLLAARVLADFYEAVTIVERDALPEAAVNRRGVPQGRHIHLLWGRGSRVLETLFPGLCDDLIAAGTPVVDGDLSKVYLNSGGHPLPRTGHVQEFQLSTPSRPLLEWRVRERVQALANVAILSGHDVVGPTWTDGHGRVTGAIVRARPSGDERVLESDLVVDASGRGSRTPAFLAAMKYARPREDYVDVNLTYSSQLLRLPPGILDEVAVIIGPTKRRPTGMGIVRNENDTSMFTIYGMAGRQPPSEFAEMLAFVEGFTPERVVSAIGAGRPVAEGARHRLPNSRWRRYDRLRRFPAGLLVLGDALCSFNPIYGQGMTVAALEAIALQECLSRDRNDLARDYFDATAKLVRAAWQLSTSGDLSLPDVAGPRPLQVRIVNRYVGRVQAAAEHDIVVAKQLSNVVGLIDPPSRLMRPSIATRVAMSSLDRRGVAV